MKKTVAVIVVALGAFACKHDPYPAPPGGMGNDTINNPIDTSGNDPTGKPCHPDTVYYARDIQPILSANCAYSGCHDAGTSQDGVTLNNYDNVFNTGDIRPGDPDGSDLYEMITEDPDDRMPPRPNNRLAQAQINLIRKWIMQGAQNLECDGCDTTNLSYSGRISEIITQNCVSCHSGNNPPNGRLLNSYSHVQDALLNTNLMQRINGAAGVNVMPPGGKMNACNVRSIEIWFNQGMPQ